LRWRGRASSVSAALVDFAGAFEDFARALLLDVANTPRRPDWKAGSLYKRYAK